MDAIDLIKIAVPATIGIAALALSILVATRNRTIFKPRLVFAFRFFEGAYPEVPKKHLRKKRPVAVFFHERSGGRLDSVPIPLRISNPTSRRIGEVTIELTYPRAFFAPNSQYEENLEVIADRFGKSERDEIAEQRKMLSMRQTADIGGVARVRYNLGSIRPGEEIGFAEVLRVPTSSEAFLDSQYTLTSFSNSLSQMEKSPFLRAMCHVRVSIFTDISKREDFNVDVVVCNEQVSKEKIGAVYAYSGAYWLGEVPEGVTYLRIPGFFRGKLLRRVVFDVIGLGHEVRASSERDGNIVVARRGDPFSSDYGVGWTLFPGFDVRKMPSSIDNTDDAVRTIGFIRPDLLREKLLKMWG